MDELVVELGKFSLLKVPFSTVKKLLAKGLLLFESLSHPSKKILAANRAKSAFVIGFLLLVWLFELAPLFLMVNGSFALFVFISIIFTLVCVGRNF